MTGNSVTHRFRSISLASPYVQHSDKGRNYTELLVHHEHEIQRAKTLAVTLEDMEQQVSIKTGVKKHPASAEIAARAEILHNSHRTFRSPTTPDPLTAYTSRASCLQILRTAIQQQLPGA